MINDYNSVNCFQFVSENRSYIMPSVAIVEILPYKDLKLVPNKPDWLYGVLLWKNVNIPIVNLGLEEAKPIEKTKLTRLLVFHSLLEDNQSKQLPLIGTIIAQIPKSLTIVEKQLKYADNFLSDAISYPVIGRGIQADITDLEKLSNKVSESFGSFGSFDY